MSDWSPFRAYGSRRRGGRLVDGVVMAVFLALGAWLWWGSRGLPAYEWQWGLLGEFLIRRSADGHWQPGLLLRGLGVTLRVGFWIVAFSFLLGGVLGVLSARKSFWRVWPISLFVTLARNTPPLVILFCVYFFAGSLMPVTHMEDVIKALPDWFGQAFGICVAPPGQLDRMLAAVLALGCYQGAYVAEIVRSGVESVDKGQWEAARSLGFGACATLWHIILPQAMRLMIPPLTGQAISTFKDSALASLISLPELTFQSLEIMAISNMTFEIWTTTGILYLGLGIICGLLGHWLEKRFSRWHRQPPA